MKANFFVDDYQNGLWGMGVLARASKEEMNWRFGRTAL
jgi:hypothetical protein